MVVIHFKKSDHNQFLYEVPNTVSVEDVISQLVEINNYRVYLDRLCVSIEDLATHGPMKPEELRGISYGENSHQSLTLIIDNNRKAIVQKYVDLPKLANEQRYNEDKNCYRTGVILGQNITDEMIKVITEAKSFLSKQYTESKKQLTLDILKKQGDICRGVMMMAYPAYHSLPEWEPVVMILENQVDWYNQQCDVGDYVKASEQALWYAGKEMVRGKYIKDYIKNDKTKVVGKISKLGSGAPVREPLIDQDAHKNMLSFYYKKQEEQKKLEEENDDNYLDSEWANSNNLKNNLQGVSSDIGWKVGKKRM